LQELITASGVTPGIASTTEDQFPGFALAEPKI